MEVRFFFFLQLHRYSFSNELHCVSMTSVLLFFCFVFVSQVSNLVYSVIQGFYFQK